MEAIAQTIWADTWQAIAAVHRFITQASASIAFDYIGHAPLSVLGVTLSAACHCHDSLKPLKDLSPLYLPLLPQVPIYVLSFFHIFTDLMVHGRFQAFWHLFLIQGGLCFVQLRWVGSICNMAATWQCQIWGFSYSSLSSWFLLEHKCQQLFGLRRVRFVNLVSDNND